MASRKWLTEGSLVEVAAPMNDAGLAGSYFRAVVVRRYVRKGKAGSLLASSKVFATQLCHGGLLDLSGGRGRRARQARARRWR